MTAEQIKEKLLDLGTTMDTGSIGDNMVFSLDDQIVGVIYTDKKPLKISLRCDRNLIKKLSNLYESASPSKLLNPTKYLDLILAGQLSPEQVGDLIGHAYYQIAGYPD